MMGMYGPGFGIWGALLGGLMMLLFWGGLIVLVVWAVRQFGDRRGSGEDPLAVLNRRLAAGEITQEQYEQTRRALQR